MPTAQQDPATPEKAPTRSRGTEAKGLARQATPERLRLGPVACPLRVGAYGTNLETRTRLRASGPCASPLEAHSPLKKPQPTPNALSGKA